MLDIRYIKENKIKVIERLKVRGRDYTEIVENAIDLDIKRRDTQQELDGVRHQLNLKNKR